MRKYNLNEIENKKIKANNGNIGYYDCWQPTACGARIWLTDRKEHCVGSILLKDIKKFEEE